MFRIGVFSQMNRVTIKALRYYERVGLLLPEKVDETTGYRYYSTKQMIKLHRIISLKQAGCSIKEISELLEDDLSQERLENTLSLKVDQLEQEKTDIQSKISHIKTYLTNTKEENSMSQDVIIKELPEVIVASYRTVIPNYDALYKVAPEMGKKMKKHGAVCSTPPYCFNRYHDGEHKESDIDVEICEAVVKKLPDADEIVYKTMPKVSKAACILHKGSYDSLSASYGKIMQWIEQNGYEVLDVPRESYIDGPWNKKDPAEWVTEIQVPIK